MVLCFNDIIHKKLRQILFKTSTFYALKDSCINFTALQFIAKILSQTLDNKGADNLEACKHSNTGEILSQTCSMEEK